MLFFDRDKEIKLVSIGKPIDNTNVYILDANFNQVKNGEVGEIFLAGTGLARGYLNNPKLTNERFILNPNGDGQRLYRTGDLAMQLHDGNIKYLGREDDQVKIRGFRIELKEIEYQLLKSGLVKNAFVTMKTDASRNKQLIAYVVADQIQSDALILMLRSTFPEYMIPNKFVYLDAVPLTPNGKVNAQALPDPFVSYQPVKDPTANVIQKSLKLF
ncbi:AMP-binding protein [Paenibacillus beijingensis]|uniref:AMP-binding protein n=1 Tax=Paenibacillus beijingensis TaxID=1126833 RepID=UPI000A7D6767|nr:AMP-binding protein [Paenibacillus beijingensis]